MKICYAFKFLNYLINNLLPYNKFKKKKYAWNISTYISIILSLNIKTYNEIQYI